MTEEKLLVDWQLYPLLKQIFEEPEELISLSTARSILNQFISVLQQSGEEAKPIFEMLSGELSALAMGSDHWLVARYSLDMAFSGTDVSAERLAEQCSSQDLSFYESNYVYWNLLSIVFSQRHKFDDNTRYSILQSAFLGLFEKYQSLVSNAGSEQDNTALSLFQDIDIVIVTNQFLVPTHAPTRLCIDMASYYHSVGFSVAVVNANLLPTDAESLYVGGKLFNSIKQFSHAGYDIVVDNEKIVDFSSNNLTYTQLVRANDSFKFYQCSSVDEHIAIVNAIEQSQTKLVIALSDNNLMGEVLTNFGVKTVCFPTVSDTPITINIPALLRTRVPPEHIAFDKFKDCLFTPDHYPHQHSISNNVSRESLGWGMRQFIVAVVGSRLVEELDDKFWSSIARLLESSGKIAIAFVGSDELIIPKLLAEFESRIFIHGHQKDLYSVISLADLFLNPDRVGGGTGCVMALALAKPVAALDVAYSDVAWSAGDDFCFASWESVEHFVLRCCNEVDFYEYYSKKAKQRHIPKLNDAVAYQSLLRDLQVPLPVERI